MSRRSRRRSERRDAIFQHPPRRSLTVRLSLPHVVPDRLDLLPVEDRRTYHPEKFFRPARMIWGHPVGPVRPSESKRRPGRSWLPGAISPRLKFADVQRTIICVRRKRRKEVLHALRKTGKGRGRRRPHFNFYSKISCN